MRSMRRDEAFDTTRIVGYACAGSAVAFIVALMFGAFEAREPPRDVAANLSRPAAASVQ